MNDGRTLNAQLRQLDGQYADAKRRVREGTVSFDLATTGLQRIIEGQGEAPKHSMLYDHPFLRRVYPAGREILLPITDGMQTIIMSEGSVFESVDPSFKELGLTKRSADQLQDRVEVLELYADATPWEVFTTFKKPLTEIALTQAQIVAFCKRHRRKLLSTTDPNGDNESLFLCEQGRDYFVVTVCFRGGLELHATDASRFIEENMCSDEEHGLAGGYLHRIIVRAANL